MRKSITIPLVLLLAAQVFAVDIDYRIGGHAGWIMPDGKVDKIAQSEGKWTYMGGRCLCHFLPKLESYASMEWSRCRSWIQLLEPHA